MLHNTQLRTVSAGQGMALHGQHFSVARSSADVMALSPGSGWSRG